MIEWDGTRFFVFLVFNIESESKDLVYLSNLCGFVKLILMLDRKEKRYRVDWLGQNLFNHWSCFDKVFQ